MTDNQKGFTLVEIVIVLGISCLLMIALFSLYDWHQKIYLQESNSIRITESVRRTLYNMSEIIAQATSIQSSHAFSGTTYSTGGSSVVLQVPSVSSSDAVIPATYDYIAFYLSNGSVYQVTEAGSGSVRVPGTRKLAENVQTFSLTYNNGDVTLASNVTIDMQTYLATRYSSVTVHVGDSIFLRNQ